MAKKKVIEVVEEKVETTATGSISDTLRDLGVPDSFITKLSEKQFTEEESPRIIALFEAAKKLADEGSDEETAEIYFLLSSPVASARYTGVKKLMTLINPDTTNTELTAGVVYMGSLVKAYLRSIAEEKIGRGKKIYEDKKKEKAAESKNAPNASGQFDELVVKVMQLPDSQKKALFHLLRNSIKET